MTASSAEAADTLESPAAGAPPAAGPRPGQTSLRTWKTVTRSARTAIGLAERDRVPLESHADFTAGPDRDPVALLEAQAKTRVPQLVPIRYGRMSISPFTFYRGAALPMAADLATTPTTQLYAQLCGDAHLSNFGVFASPERRLVFDVNDFDETHPGPFEWDVKRLAASIVVAGRANGFTAKECKTATLATVAAYRTSMQSLAGRTVMDVWYELVDPAKELASIRESTKLSKKELKSINRTTRTLGKAVRKDSARAVRKLTETVDGVTRLINDPPLVVPIGALVDDPSTLADRLAHLVTKYRSTLRPDRQTLLDHYSVVDVAHKVVGVGSVGTRAWVLLLQNADHDETLVLQAKEAQRSVLADFVDPVEYAEQGERVVVGQLSMQGASDIFLGWLRSAGAEGFEVDYYVRQLWDWKGSVEVEQLLPGGLTSYGKLCARTLAQAHGRTGSRVAIAAYLGETDEFDRAVTRFAVTYADQTESDHGSFMAAIGSGRITAKTGV